MTYSVMGIVGARPNYMKIAPIWRELDKHSHIKKRLIHTGQHYDENMSKVFFDDLKLPKPDLHLGVGSGPHGEQTAKVMIEIERALMADRPDLLIVVGDVNSTMAGTLVAAKIGVPVAHVEAGLRSFDRAMPEELNRMVTDILADLLFTTEAKALDNLVREGIDPERVHFTGNVMIDSLHYFRPMAEKSTILDDLGIEAGGYGLVTLHRPSNVDDPATFESILGALDKIGVDCPLVFPIHPRTRKVIDNSKLSLSPDHLRTIDPTGYLDFVKLTMSAKLVLTDSGGIQEETTVLGIPCLTIRENTERPITIEVGTNRLVGTDAARILEEGRKILSSEPSPGQIPELWDGKAAERIVSVIDAFCL